MSRSLFSSGAPTAAIEIASNRVAAVRLGEQGGRPAVLGYASEPLDEGVVTPSLMSTNLHNRQAVVDAAARVVGRLGGRVSRVGLVLPDPVAKVSLVQFEKVPARADDLTQLVRWQVRKVAPFKIEEAQIAHSRGASTPDGGAEFVVALARRDVVAEYEAVCEAVGVRPGLVDLASFNLVNAVLAGSPSAGDWLLVAIAPAYTTIAIVRDGNLIFYRSRPSDEQGELADLVHQTAMYYEDRLGGAGFERIVLAGGGGQTPADDQRVQDELRARLSGRVERIDPGQAIAIPAPMTAGGDGREGLATLVGLLVRDIAA